MYQYKTLSFIRSSAFLATLFLSGCFLFQRADNCDTRITTCKLEQSNVTAIELIEGESHDIEICACRSWNRSGIKVKEGQKYTFEVVQITNCWQDASLESDPRIGWKNNMRNNTFKILVDFFGEKRTDKANWYALVGTVDKCDKSAFAVLNTNSDLLPKFHECEKPYSHANPDPITIMEDGELYFYANDMEGYYFNNKGILTLRVRNAAGLEPTKN